MLTKSIEDNGTVLDEETSSDMQNIMEHKDQQIGNKYSEDSFQFVSAESNTLAIVKKATH